MSQEAMRHFDATCIGRWIACANELDAINFHPQVVVSPETSLFHELAHEHDYALRSIQVFLWQVYLITKNNEPTLCAQTIARFKDYVFATPHIRTVLLKHLQNYFGRCSTRKIQTGQNDALD